MIPTNRLYEIDPAILKQAAIWGTGGLLASKLTQDEPKTVAEDKKSKSNTIKQGLVAAASGAIGAAV